MRVNLNDTKASVITSMAENNVESANVLTKLLADESWIFYVSQMDDMQIYGSAIWFSYKYFAKENLNTLKDLLTERDENLVKFMNNSGYRHVTRGTSGVKEELAWVRE